MPRMPASASFAHSSRSKFSSPPSTSFRRSCESSPSRIWGASPWRSSCSPEKEKPPVSSLLAGSQRHAEAEHRDEIALHLVHAAAEREDDEPAVHVLEARLQQRTGSGLLEVRALAQDLHEEPERLEVELGAEDLRRRRVRRLQRALGRLRRDLPVDEAQELEARVHTRQVELHPLLVDDP